MISQIDFMSLLKKIKIFSAVTFALLLLVIISNTRPAYAASKNTNIGVLKKLKPKQTYFFSGIITKINADSITLYGGLTIAINSSTICKTYKLKNGSTGDCSMLFRNKETVGVVAFKNNGKLIAAEIRQMFF